jgi:pyrrolidone-carboxylate peptidase
LNTIGRYVCAVTFYQVLDALDAMEKNRSENGPKYLVLFIHVPSEEIRQTTAALSDLIVREAIAFYKTHPDHDYIGKKHNSHGSS